jgi:hypothetical protein
MLHANAEVQARVSEGGDRPTSPQRQVSSAPSGANSTGKPKKLTATTWGPAADYLANSSLSDNACSRGPRVDRIVQALPHAGLSAHSHHHHTSKLRCRAGRMPLARHWILGAPSSGGRRPVKVAASRGCRRDAWGQLAAPNQRVRNRRWPSSPQKPVDEMGSEEEIPPQA